MQTPKYIAVIFWLILSLFIIILFRQFGWLPNRLDSYGIYIEPTTPVTPEPGQPTDVPSIPMTPTEPGIVSPQPNLIAAWNFDQAMGSVIFDRSGNNYQATGSGAWRTGSECIQGSCFGFIADKQSTLTFTLPSLQTYTWSGWVKPNSLNFDEQEIFMAANDSLGVTILGKRLQFYDRASLVGDTDLQTGRYYHVAVTNDGFTKTIYLDGETDGMMSASSGISGGIGRMGSAPGGRYFDGSLDDVRLYDRVLSPSEIKFLLTSRGLNQAPSDNPTVTYPTAAVAPSMPASPLVTSLKGGDIEVQNFMIDGGTSWSATDNNYLDFRAIISNVGDKAVFIPENTQFNIMCDSANCNKNERLFASMSVGTGTFTLAPGESRILTVMSMNIAQFKLSPGAYELMFVADMTQLVPESNRANNKSRLTIELR